MYYNTNMGNIQHLKAGFSLIELMVVISIVAILSAVAMASYKNYAYKAKLMKTMIPVYATVDKALAYYNKVLSFPNVVQQGFTAGGDNNTTASPVGATEVLPLVYQIYSMGNIGGNCNIGQMYFHVAADQNNYYTNSGQGRYFQVVYNFWDIGGTIHKLCQYFVYDVGVDPVPVTDSLLPNCYNVAIPAESAEFTSLANNYELCGA
jgi:prepilin-type N-terminal cleavage/methylation domain-containing protein